MDDAHTGLAFRRVRLRLGWRQQDVADRAGVSRAAYSLIERGHVDRVSVALLRRVGAALEIRIEMRPRWRGADLDRMVAAGHARMHEHLARLLATAAWDARPEVSFSHFGERGVIDVVAWHAMWRALLIVELKTTIVDVSDLLATMDRRRRLAPHVARSLGWDPVAVGIWVVVAETRTNRRRLAEHRTVLRSAFPRDGRAMSGWLQMPSGPLSALSFLTDDTARSARPGSIGVHRVRTRRPCTGPRLDRDRRSSQWRLAGAAVRNSAHGYGE